jgi:WHEP-TRS domain
MVDLAALEQEIAEIGNQIRSLKASSGSPDEVSAAVALLVEKKKLYADHNNGIGVDGKPFGSGSGGGANDAGKKKSKTPKEDKGPAKQVRALQS